ncbi:MAG: response regulator [Nitrospiraceae bacterium]|nr:MAG: response regulator [Nitrospiraceae bacterium]
MSDQIRILCVDDEKNILKAIQRLFLDSDFEILTASSGDEGLDMLGNNGMIQLVISDYRMPNMNGIDFLKAVYEKCPETIRIVISGYADTASIVEAINVGHIYKFIPKPWNDDELKVTIAKALEHYEVQQENIQLTKELEKRNDELKAINNSLESLVEVRTSELMLQNKILTASQNILDALPMAVIGVDPEGLVVQCNQHGYMYFSKRGGSVLGLHRADVLPENVNGFIDSVIEKGAYTADLGNNGAKLHARGIYMKHATGQEGMILVFDKKEPEPAKDIDDIMNDIISESNYHKP